VIRKPTSSACTSCVPSSPPSVSVSSLLPLRLLHARFVALHLLYAHVCFTPAAPLLRVRQSCDLRFSALDGEVMRWVPRRGHLRRELRGTGTPRGCRIIHSPASFARTRKSVLAGKFASDVAQYAGQIPSFPGSMSAHSINARAFC
jgi:hypothetical protein